MDKLLDISITEFLFQGCIVGASLYVIYKLIRKFLSRLDNGASLAGFVKAILFAVFTYSVLSHVTPLKTMLSGIVASSGVLAIVLSLAAQESIGNIISGTIILFTKPFKTGDFIKIDSGKYMGYVEQITLRHTVIRTFRNNRIAIPNSIMNSSPIENFNLTKSKKNNFLELQISYGSDIDKAIEIIKAVCSRNKLNTGDKVGIKILDFAESGIKILVIVESASSMDGFNMLSELRYSIKKEFDKNGITIPYPTRTVYVNDKTKNKKS